MITRSAGTASAVTRTVTARVKPGPPPVPGAAVWPAGSRPSPQPTVTRASAAAGMPQWLKTILLAVGLLIGAAFLAEPVPMIRRRRRQAAIRAAGLRMPGSGQRLGSGQPSAEKARIVLAGYDRLVVTCSKCDGSVCVLRPPR
jgi:hypothetical protein